MLVELFELARQQVKTSDNKLFNFVDSYIQNHAVIPDENID